MSEQSYYEILQVRDDASIEVIKASYKRLSKMYHPDNIETGDAEKFKKVVEAFERVNYDSTSAEKESVDSKTSRSWSPEKFTVINRLKRKDYKTAAIIAWSRTSRFVVTSIRLVFSVPWYILIFLWNFIKFILSLCITWIIGKGLILLVVWIYYSTIGVITKIKWTDDYEKKLDSLLKILFPKYPINYHWEWIFLIVVALVLAFVETKDPNFL